jgi:hypothetical protein
MSIKPQNFFFGFFFIALGGFIVGINIARMFPNIEYNTAWETYYIAVLLVLWGILIILLDK